MAKAATTKKTKRGSYKVLGVMPDGVEILAPKTKATHFTPAQIRKTIAKVNREFEAKKLENGE
jgi:hypothetical protein